MQRELIDRNALMEQIEKLCDKCRYEFCMPCCTECKVDDVVAIIVDTPVVETASEPGPLDALEGKLRQLEERIERVEQGLEETEKEEST